MNSASGVHVKRGPCGRMFPSSGGLEATGAAAGAGIGAHWNNLGGIVRGFCKWGRNNAASRRVVSVTCMVALLSLPMYMRFGCLSSCCFVLAATTLCISGELPPSCAGQCKCVQANCLFSLQLQLSWKQVGPISQRCVLVSHGPTGWAECGVSFAQVHGSIHALV